MKKHTMRASLMLFGLLLWGCTNQPDSLRMRIVPAQAVFGADEPIRLNVTFSPSSNAVCISRPTPSRFELAVT